MTTFYNYAFKIKTCWAKKVIKPILETSNANDDIVYVWFILSLIKKLKSCNVQRNTSKCTKFTIKTKIIQIECKIKYAT